MTEQLSQSQIDVLTNVIAIASPAKINTLVIDEYGVRAIDETGTVALMMPDVEAFPAPISLTRIPQLKARMDLAAAKAGFKVEYTSGETGTENKVNFIKGLTFKATGVKADYKAGDPSKARAPKKINDPDAITATLSAELVGELQSAIAAFSTKLVEFSINDGILQAKVRDENNDEFSLNICDVQYEEPLLQSYNAINISSLLKLCLSEGEVKIGIGSARGILNIQQGSYVFYVMPAKVGKS